MLDLTGVISLGLLFALAIGYVHGCERLKGTRS
jgi:hypothetical protein